MRKAKLTLLLGITALMLAILTSIAYAATATYGSVTTKDGPGNTGQIRVLFNLGETVYINWTAEPTKTVDIQVKFLSNNSVVETWTDMSDSGEVTFVPDVTGRWRVSLVGLDDLDFAIVTIFVVPDVPLGVIMVFGACFAGFSIMKLRRKHN